MAIRQLGCLDEPDQSRKLRWLFRNFGVDGEIDPGLFSFPPATDEIGF
jgi:hypothetical protein